MFFRPWFFIVHFAIVTRCNYTILSVVQTYLRVSICVYVTIYMYMRVCLRISIYVCVLPYRISIRTCVCIYI